MTGIPWMVWRQVSTSSRAQDRELYLAYGGRGASGVCVADGRRLATMLEDGT